MQMQLFAPIIPLEVRRIVHPWSFGIVDDMIWLRSIEVEILICTCLYVIMFVTPWHLCSFFNYIISLLDALCFLIQTCALDQRALQQTCMGRSTFYTSIYTIVMQKQTWDFQYVLCTNNYGQICDVCSSSSFQCVLFSQ